MKIAVLVCTLNEEQNIHSRLANLNALSVPEGVELEINVLDNGSIDRTCDIAAAMASESVYPVRIHEFGPIGKCGALFRAFSLLSADYYVLTDANTIFAPTVISSVSSAIQSHPESGVFVGNFRSVKTAENGATFFSGAQKMPLRMRMEHTLGVFTGANGGCYCVRADLVSKLGTVCPVRNDDFFISVCAASFSSARSLPNMRAFEVEDLTASQAYQQKFRDALGHYQAIKAILAHARNGHAWLAVLLRLFYWLVPLLVLMGLVGVCGPVIAAVGSVFLFLMPKTRRTVVRTIALYAGFVTGVVRPPTVAWETRR